MFFTLSLSSVLILIVQKSRPVFLAHEQKAHTATWTRLVAHGSPTVMSCFSTELQGKTLKLQRRRGQASGNCKTFYLNCSWKFVHMHASYKDHKCELGLFTSISPCPVPASVACSVPPVPQHPATQREVYHPTSSTTHPASWKRATPSPSSPEKSPKHSTSSKKSNFYLCFTLSNILKMKMFLSDITQHIKLNSSCSDPLIPCCFFSVFLNRVDSSGSLSRREQKRAQYQHVRAHMQKEDGRVIAHGWSLPGKCKARVIRLDSI